MRPAASRLARLQRQVQGSIAASHAAAPASQGSLRQMRTVWAMKNIDPVNVNPTGNLKGKTLFVSGASRGIGLAIALAAAKDGANVAIVAKTTKPHPKLPGTIYTAAEEVEKAGGKAIAICCDIRSEEQVQAAVNQTVDAFGGIDILVNNASAINLSPTERTDMKRYDLMHAINTRGTFLCSKLCIPHLRKSENPHILNLSPPLNMDAKWFAPHVAYTIAKFGMSMCALGMSEELKDDGIAVNTLWPRTTIKTAAVQNLLGGDALSSVSRTPEIMGDAAYAILTSPSKGCTGNFFVDDEVMATIGVQDLSKYNVTPGMKQTDLQSDFFV